jgi:hypothetical protein
MLQNPRVAFRDPHLQQSSVEKNQQNQPRPWAGAFAVVYKGISGDGQRPFALRVFTSESPERRERYELISAYMKGHKPRCLVEFEYRDQSIRSAGDGKWYPLILMDWVQGETLFKWARAQCLAGKGDSIGFIADRWLDAVKELDDCGIAHGDLQHANIMVTAGGELKLVDYDCMCVPALAGRRNLEVGVEPYQHPQRDAKTLLSLDLDHFSALFIYVALRALSINPLLWIKYIEQSGYDKLLFRREDFQSPLTSALYRELVHMGNSEIKELTEQLFALTRVRMDQVPPLGQLVNSYAKVERLLTSQQWGAAVQLLNRRGHFRDAPEHLQPLIREAYEYVCRQEAWATFIKIPAEISETADRQLVEAWNEVLFAAFPPAEQERMRVAEARHRVQVIDRLHHLAQQGTGTLTLAGEKRLLETAAQLPLGYRYGLRERVERAHKCIIALGRLERAIHDPVSEEAIVAAWAAVQAARCERLVGPVWNARVAMAQQRVPLLEMLAEITDDLPPEQRDAKLLAAWQEELLADCQQAEPWRAAYQQAVARREVLRQLREAVAGRDEAAIVQWTRQTCLAGYPLPAAWAEPIKTARRRARRTEALLAALEQFQQQQQAAAGGAGVSPADTAETAAPQEPAAVPQERGAGAGPALHELFDVALVRRAGERFAPYETLLAQWVRAEVLPLEKLGLQAVEEGLVAVNEAEGNCRVQWIWPAARLADRCVLAVCPAEPAAADDPQAVTAHLRVAIGRQEWDQGGGSRLIATEKEWEGACVVVWAIVDLGFQTFFSPPLLLGHLKSRSRWTWKGLRVFSSRQAEHEAEGQPEPSP